MILWYLVAVAIIYLGWVYWWRTKEIPKSSVAVKIIRINRTAAENAKRQYIQKQNELRATARLSDLTELAVLYLNGVEDRYDILGRKILGIQPQTQQALNLLYEAIRCGHTPALFVLAKVHHYGAPGIEVNLQTAQNLYYRVLTSTADGRIQNLAREKLADIQEELHPKPRPPPNSHAWQPTFLSKLTAALRSPTVINVNKLFRVPAGTSTQAQVQVQVQLANPVQATATGGITNDMHNVHDHAVMATLKTSYDRLSSETKKNIPKHQCLKELKQFTKSYLKNDQQLDAMTAIDAVERNIIPHTGIGATESDVLAVVWNRLNDKFKSDTDTQKTIKENLANGLAEMVEHGKVCCVTGRLSRILDSLNCIDDAVQIKPTFAINQEMMDKAAKISTDLVDSADKSVRDDYNNAKDTKEVTTLQEQIKKKIRSELEKDYVKSGILTQDGFNTQIDSWIDAI